MVFLAFLILFCRRCYCYASTFVKDISESYAIEEICRRLQAMQAITS
jgi:hypothetical protein